MHPLNLLCRKFSPISLPLAKKDVFEWYITPYHQIINIKSIKVYVTNENLLNAFLVMMLVFVFNLKWNCFSNFCRVRFVALFCTCLSLHLSVISSETDANISCYTWSWKTWEDCKPALKLKQIPKQANNLLIKFFLKNCFIRVASWLASLNFTQHLQRNTNQKWTMDSRLKGWRQLSWRQTVIPVWRKQKENELLRLMRTEYEIKCWVIYHLTLWG